MTGFVKKRGNTWTAFWETKDPATGKRRQHSKGGFRTKKLAQENLSTVVGAVTAGHWRPEVGLTVRQLLTEHWLPAQRSRGLRPSSLSSPPGRFSRSRENLTRDLPPTAFESSIESLAKPTKIWVFKNAFALFYIPKLVMRIRARCAARRSPGSTGS